MAAEEQMNLPEGHEGRQIRRHSVYHSSNNVMHMNGTKQQQQQVFLLGPLTSAKEF